MKDKELDPAMWPYDSRKKLKQAESKSALSDGVSLRDCECEGFRRYNNILNAQQVFAAMRGMDYPAEGIFIYCQWCGKKREAI